MLTNEELKEKLIILQDKIKGVYIGSMKEREEINLKDEKLKKYNIKKFFQLNVCLIRMLED